MATYFQSFHNLKRMLVILAHTYIRVYNIGGYVPSVIRIPYRSLTIVHSSLLRNAAPEANDLIDDKSYLSAIGDRTKAIKIGGTTNANVTLNFCTARKKLSGENLASMMAGVRVCKLMIDVIMP